MVAHSYCSLDAVFQHLEYNPQRGFSRRTIFDRSGKSKSSSQEVPLERKLFGKPTSQ